MAHRDWAATGQFIKVSMFDDRLEIESPGRFPNIVTADNISYTRFSRNKTISRVMTEFEWVRELNEGVRKIYSDMADAGLPDPEYIETPNTVRLILRNNIDERAAHRNKAAAVGLNEGSNEGLTPDEKRLLDLISKSPKATQKWFAETTGFSIAKVERLMKALRERGIIQRNGSKKKGTWLIIPELNSEK